MRYRVTFRKRFNQEGDPSEAPDGFLDYQLPDGVIREKELVETIDPPSLHVQGKMDEDDNFESYGSEVWDYVIATGREKDFQNAAENSRMVMEVEELDDV